MSARVFTSSKGFHDVNIQLRIIALMGGKLDMDTDDMMKEFGILGKNVFSEEKLAISDGLPNAHQYEKELREMVERHGGDEDRQLLDGQPETCLV